MQIAEVKQSTNNVSKKETVKPGLFFQPKLTINAPGDQYEQEADAMADRVMRMPVNGNPFFSPKPLSVSRLQRKCQHCEEEEKLQRKETNSEETVADATTENYIGSLNGKGKSLTNEERSFFEPRFGYDFSDVQLHTNKEANQSAKSINALAYTHGNNIVFGSGQYQSNTDSGKQLMAHELTHVVQQGTNIRLIQRYSHQDCSEDDLRNDIWPSDYLAKQMVGKSIRVLSSNPTSTVVLPLLNKYFMSSSPSISTILNVYNNIKDTFDGNDYTYECEDDCGGSDLGYVYGIWSHIHLCMSHIRNWSISCIARTIVHEFSHYYAGTDDNAYCKSGCGFSSCPVSLGQSDALSNADSYACFAYELFSLSVPAGTASASPQNGGPQDAGVEIPGGVSE